MDTANVGEIIPFDTFALRAGAALVLGVLVGLNREVKRKPLGARACQRRRKKRPVGRLQNQPLSALEPLAGRSPGKGLSIF